MFTPIAMVVAIVKNAKAIGVSMRSRIVDMPGAKGSIRPHYIERFFTLAQERIRVLKAHGESQDTIALRWGVSQNTISKIENGLGGLGIKALVGMRADLHMEIQDILGLPPLGGEATVNRSGFVRRS
jgi:DNA-binding XRE family transcriptional regulator